MIDITLKYTFKEKGIVKQIELKSNGEETLSEWIVDENLTDIFREKIIIVQIKTSINARLNNNTSKTINRNHVDEWTWDKIHVDAFRLNVEQNESSIIISTNQSVQKLIIQIKSVEKWARKKCVNEILLQKIIENLVFEIS